VPHPHSHSVDSAYCPPHYLDLSTPVACHIHAEDSLSLCRSVRQCAIYRAMHISAKCGIAIVILSVRLSVCSVRAL